jgi:GDP-4-dehydro-6-deoxy-D-mannose reductase
MRAVVTGATGFVGGHLLEHLSASGDQVIGLSPSGVWPAGLRHLAGVARLEPCDLVEVGEAELADLLARKQPEAVYHLAAQSNPQQSLIHPRETWSVNLGGTLNLLEALRRADLKPRIVLIGSGVCYGNPEPEHIPVTENCPLRPSTAYAASKAAADLLGIEHHLAYGAEVLIARPFNHAGPRQSDHYVLSSMARQVAEVEAGRRVAVEHGNLAVVRDFTDVRDIVRAYRLLVVEGRPGTVYNIGTGRDLTLERMLEILIGFARTPIPTRTDPTRMRAVDLPRLLADSSRIRDHTGWEPTLPVATTLADMLRFWRESLDVSLNAPNFAPSDPLPTT